MSTPTTGREDSDEPALKPLVNRHYSVLSVECAPMSKSARAVHEFMTQRSLPGIFASWGIFSIFMAAGLFTYLYYASDKIARNSDVPYLVALALAPPLYFLSRVLMKPTHLNFSASGIQQQWNRTIHHSGKPLRWHELQRISVVQPANTSRVQSRLLVFQAVDRTIDLKIDEVTDISQLPALYNMIVRHAPNVPRDPEVQSILESDKASASYTALWLRALTAPPDRTRLAPLAPGTKLQDGTYEIIEKIGAGGQGVAYTAKSHSLIGPPCVIVLKEYILPVGVTHSTKVDSLDKFQREAQILWQISHPRIVKLVDFFFEDHRGYMAMEYVEGKTLSVMVQERGPLPETEVAKLMEQMIDILDYLHTREPAVVHRDFTPDNLILTNDGILKLIDFNVAQQKVTATATVVGKHAYIAPDQFRGQATPQSDIYSMGATLFFLLTGCEPKPISESHPQNKIPSISNKMDEIVARCTAIEIEKRFKCATEMKNEMNNHVLQPQQL